MQYIDIEELKSGFCTSKPVWNKQNVLLITANRILNESNIKRLKKHNVEKLCIFDKNIDDNNVLNADKILYIANAVVNNLLEKKEISIELNKLNKYDPATFVHSINVAINSTIIGIKLGLKQNELTDLCTAALLHDVGKIFIDDSIILKKGKLTEEEKNIVKKHSELGGKIAKIAKLNKKIQLGILDHHENIDGSGYPNKKNGNNISLFGRILHVADVYDALVSKRTYKDVFDCEEIINYMYSNIGIQFEKEIVETLFSSIIFFPKNTIVELSDGTKAVVVKYNEHLPLRPVIKCEDGRLVDMSSEQLNITIKYFAK